MKKLKKAKKAQASDRRDIFAALGFEKLGLKRVARRTKKNSKIRAKFLRQQLEAGKYRGELKQKAQYYLNIFTRLSA